MIQGKLLAWFIVQMARPRTHSLAPSFSALPYPLCPILRLSLSLLIITASHRLSLALPLGLCFISLHALNASAGHFMGDCFFSFRSELTGRLFREPCLEESPSSCSLMYHPFGLSSEHFSLSENFSLFICELLKKFCFSPHTRRTVPVVECVLCRYLLNA